MKELDELLKKVKVPAFVAEYIEAHRKWGPGIFIGDWLADNDAVDKWLYNNSEKENNRRFLIAVKAFVEGYEVEEEPLFYIRLTIPSSSVVGLYLGFNKDGIFDHSYGKPHVTWDWKYTFTEHEIKSIDERYWPFAVPVEKV